MTDLREKLVFDLAVEVLDSFEKLEVVLALHRATTPLSQAQLVSQLGLESDQIVDAMQGLVASGAVAGGSAGYRLADEGPWTAHLRALADLHKTDRMTVVTAMSNAALERMRARAARAFADAFVIRSKKKGEDDA